MEAARLRLDRAEAGVDIAIDEKEEAEKEDD